MSTYLRLSFLGLVAGAAVASYACGSSNDGASSGTGNGDAGSDASVAVRSCGRNLTAPLPTHVSIFVPTLYKVALGQAYSETTGLGSASYEMGVPYYTQGGGSDTHTGDGFPYLNLPGAPKAVVIVSDGDDAGTSASTSLIANEPDGGSPLADIANQYATIPTRLVTSVYSTSVPGTFDLADGGRTPSAPATGEYVYELQPQQFSLVATKFEFPDSCAVGAVQDALAASDAPTATTILAAAANPLVSQILVREGVSISIELATNVHRPTLEALFPNGTSTCGTQNLTACATLQTTAADTINAFLGDASDGSEYTPIQTQSDPNWSFLEYDVSSLD